MSEVLVVSETSALTVQETVLELIDTTSEDAVLDVAQQGPPGAQGPVGPAGPEFTPSSLPLATTARPDEVLVRQGGAWFRATFVQLLGWLGLTNVTVNSQAITVGGANTTIGAR